MKSLFISILIVLFFVACGGENSSTDIDSNGTTKSEIELIPETLVTLTDINGNTVSENDTLSFTVMLTYKPESDVVLNISSSNPLQALVRTKILSFTSENYNVAQTVYVDGVEEFPVDRVQDYNIVFAPLESVDSTFDGYDIDDIHVDGIHLRLASTQDFNVSANMVMLEAVAYDFNGKFNDLNITLNKAPEGMKVYSGDKLYWVPKDYQTGQSYDVELSFQDQELEDSVSFKVFVNRLQVRNFDENSTSLILNEPTLKLDGLILNKEHNGNVVINTEGLQIINTIELNEKVIALSEVFSLKYIDDSDVKIEVLLPTFSLPAGYSLNDIKLYLFASQVLDSSGLWHQSGEAVMLKNVEGEERLSFGLSQNVAYQVVLKKDTTPLNSISKAPSFAGALTISSVTCKKGLIGDYYECNNNVGGFSSRVKILNYGTSALSSTYDVSYVADAYFLANLTLSQKMSGSLTGDTLVFENSILQGHRGMFDPQEHRTLHLSSDLITTIDELYVTTAHELFHVYQYYGLLPNINVLDKQALMHNRRSKWLIEGSAAWFEDQGELDRMGNIDAYSELRVLEAGVNPDYPSTGYDSDPYARSLLFRGYENICNGNAGTLIQESIGGLNDSSYGIKKFKTAMSRSCRIDSFMASYNFGTMYLNDVTTIDWNEPQPRYGFKKPTHTFSYLNNSSPSGRYYLDNDDVITIPDMGALSFVVPDITSDTKTEFLKIVASDSLSVVMQFTTSDSIQNTQIRELSANQDGTYGISIKLTEGTSEYFVTLVNTKTDDSEFISAYAAVDIGRKIEYSSSLGVFKNVIVPHSKFVESRVNEQLLLNNPGTAIYTKEGLNPIGGTYNNQASFIESYDSKSVFLYSYNAGRPYILYMNLISGKFSIADTKLAIDMKLSNDGKYLYVFGRLGDIEIFETSAFVTGVYTVESAGAVSLGLDILEVEMSIFSEEAYAIGQKFFKIDLSNPLLPRLMYVDDSIGGSQVSLSPNAQLAVVDNMLIDISNEFSEIIKTFSRTSGLKARFFTEDLLHINQVVYDVSAIRPDAKDPLLRALGMSEVFDFKSFSEKGVVKAIMPGLSGSSFYMLSDQKIDGINKTYLSEHFFDD